MAVGGAAITNLLSPYALTSALNAYTPTASLTTYFAVSPIIITIQLSGANAGKWGISLDSTKSITCFGLTCNNLLTVSSGGAAITGNSSITGTLSTGALTVSSGNLSVSSGNATISGTLNCGVRQFSFFLEGT